MNDSMINPSIVKLLNKVDNRYSLVVATSRRARQIIDGFEPSVDKKDRKPLTIAIDEVNEGNIEVLEGQDKSVSLAEVKLEEALAVERLLGVEVGVEEGVE